jgi:hypothetical protein
LHRSSRKSVGGPSSSAIFSRRALDRVVRAEPGRRNSRYRFYCCGGASRVRRAIFGWPAAGLMKTLAQRRQKAVDLTKRAGGLLKASMKFVRQRWAQSDRDKHSTTSAHVYEIRPRVDKHGVDLISDAIGYAKFYSGSHDAVIRVYDEAGNVIERQEDAGQFKRVVRV